MGKMMREEWRIDFCNQLEEETHGETNRRGGGARVQPDEKTAKKIETKERNPKTGERKKRGNSEKKRKKKENGEK
jgi:hypothetical protein